MNLMGNGVAGRETSVKRSIVGNCRAKRHNSRLDEWRRLIKRWPEVRDRNIRLPSTETSSYMPSICLLALMFIFPLTRKFRCEPVLDVSIVPSFSLFSCYKRPHKTVVITVTSSVKALLYQKYFCPLNSDWNYRFNANYCHVKLRDHWLEKIDALV